MSGQDVPPSRPGRQGRDRDPRGWPRPALDTGHDPEPEEAVAAAIDGEEDRRHGLDNQRRDPQDAEAKRLGIDPA